MSLEISIRLQKKLKHGKKSTEFRNRTSHEAGATSKALTMKNYVGSLLH